MPFLPLYDSNPLKVIPFQIVTVTIIGLCVVMFLWQVSLGEAAGERIAVALGTVPAVLLGLRDLPPGVAVVPPEFTLITSMFLHSGWMHLIGNMLFLWVFGDNIEDAMGHARFALFYLICGAAGGLLHVAVNPTSTIPAVGASGAVSGVLGAYLVLHPKVKVLVLALSRIPIRLPAYIVLGGWIVMQIVSAAIAEPGQPGVAWWAHIGGFATGLLLIFPFRRSHVPRIESRQPPPTRRIERRPSRQGPGTKTQPPRQGPWSRPK
jgi:membrane associated rhomboid family serine protease